MPSLLFEPSQWWDSPYINHFISADTIVASYADPQGLNRYSYVNNNPLRYTDPTGHMLDKGDGAGSVCPNQKCKDEVKIRKEHSNLKKHIQDCQQKPLACVPTSQSSAGGQGYSNEDIDALYEFWENVAQPLNELVSADDLYRMTSGGGWRATRYSLNLGPVEGVVQGFRQAYRDSWYQTLTPAQRILRPVLVGAEAWATDIASSKVGNAFAAAGSLGGPPGAAGGQLAGSTFATKVFEKLWMQTINPNLFNSLGAWP